MLYKFKLGYNTLKTSKNICYANGEVAVDHSTISRWWKKLFLILLFQEFMLYKFKLGHNTLKTSKNICYANGEVAVDHSTISRCGRNCS